MSSPRYAVPAALVTGVTAEVPSGVQVEVGWPGDEQERESIWCGDIEGSLSVPVFTGQPSAANPLTYDDIFGFTVYITAWEANQTSLESAARGDALAQHVRRYLRESGQIASDTANWVIVQALMSEERSITFLGKEGFRTMVEIDVEVHARISGVAE